MSQLFKRVKTCQIIESLRLSIHEHLTSVGEEMSCVLEKQQSDVCSVQINVRVFVLERLTAVEEFMCNLFQREMETLETLLERQDKLLEHFNVTKDQCVESSLQVKMSSPQPAWAVSVKQEPEELLDIDFLHLPVYKEEVSPQRIPSPVQEQPEPPQIKEEQEELLQRAEEADGSTLIIITVKSENDENREIEPLASTSTQHMKTQADVEDCGTSQPDSSECDTDDSDDWVESGEGTSASRTHTWERSQRTFTCTVCGKSFRQRNHLNLHMRIHTGVRFQSSQTQIFSCAGCSYAFTSRDFLRKHMKRSHYDLYCQVGSSATHQKQGDTPSSEQFDKTLPQQGEPKTQPVTQSGKKRCVCNHCGKGFCLLRNLKTHQVTCTGKKLHTCNHCDKSFGQLYNLKRHLLVHSGEKHFICEQCGKGFSQLIGLQRHNQCVHSGEKSFCCEVCDKSFPLSSDLKRHQTVHTEAKPFYCLQCNKTFSRLNTLNRHQRLHAKERQFLCQLCDRGFNTMCSLKRHQLLLHTEEGLFRCKTCGKSFNEECDLQKHQRVHTGPKPFPCPLCDKSFCDFKTLDKHQRVHTGEKPFHCDRCDKSFSQMYNFRRHQKLHTEPRKKN